MIDILFSYVLLCLRMFSGRYFDEISQDTGKYCFGVDDTLKALEMGAVETLICWENLDIQVCKLISSCVYKLLLIFSASYFEKSWNWRRENLVLEFCPRKGQDSLHGSGHWSGDGVGREYSTLGMDGQQLQEFWSCTRNYHWSVSPLLAENNSLN